MLAVFFYGCGNNPTEKEKLPFDTLTKKRDTTTVKEGGLSQQDSIKATGRQVLTFLKDQNFEELVKYFSNSGVLFSPYGNIDVKTGKKLDPDDFMESIHKNWMLTWGNYDGSGEPIKLSVKNYLKKFVYNADYLNAEAIGYDETIKEGNTRINLKEVYPDKHFIDYHFSGFDQKKEGMDWTSLKLVFEKQDGQYFLIAVIHDQWTI